MGVWAHDSWYSLSLYQRLGYDDQAVRLGFIHYNTGRRGRRAGRGAERLGQPRGVLDLAHDAWEIQQRNGTS